MIRVEHKIVINRPVEEVFAFHENPDNPSKWESGIVEYEQTSEGSIGVGATFREVRTFIGRRLESTSKITEHELNKKFAIKTTSGPIPLKGNVTFESLNGGTEVKVLAESELSGFFILAEPIFKRTMQRQIEGNFANLKDLLEGQA
jgi:uncharacterized membrane protein